MGPGMAWDQRVHSQNGPRTAQNTTETEGLARKLRRVGLGVGPPESCGEGYWRRRLTGFLWQLKMADAPPVD
jgi:hypothetical protein